MTLGYLKVAFPYTLLLTAQSMQLSKRCSLIFGLPRWLPLGCCSLCNLCKSLVLETTVLKGFLCIKDCSAWKHWSFKVYEEGINKKQIQITCLEMSGVRWCWEKVGWLVSSTWPLLTSGKSDLLLTVIQRAVCFEVLNKTWWHYYYCSKTWIFFHL